MKLSLKDINAMEREAFVKVFGGIFEHSPWVAFTAWGYGPFSSTQALHETMMRVVRQSPSARLLELFRAHPDLATRLEISPSSAEEQRGAGLDRLTRREYDQFTDLNRMYVEKFGFPFLFAVRGKTKDDILAAMQERIHHSEADERAQALLEIEKITGFRLRELIDDNEPERMIGSC